MTCSIIFFFSARNCFIFSAFRFIFLWKNHATNRFKRIILTREREKERMWEKHNFFALMIQHNSVNLNFKLRNDYLRIKTQFDLVSTWKRDTERLCFASNAFLCVVFIHEQLSVHRILCLDSMCDQIKLFFNSQTFKRTKANKTKSVGESSTSSWHLQNGKDE